MISVLSFVFLVVVELSVGACVCCLVRTCHTVSIMIDLIYFCTSSVQEFPCSVFTNLCYFFASRILALWLPNNNCNLSFIVMGLLLLEGRAMSRSLLGIKYSPQ